MWTAHQLRRANTALALILLAPIVVPSAADAQGWIQPDRPALTAGVERLGTQVRVRIADGIAHVEVEEHFRNNGRAIAEGVYMYPLPGEAVFQGYSLFQGDLELTGETMDARRAREIYESIVRQRKDPALIELVGHGLIRARVFPFEAGETRRITLRYTQVLRRAGHALELRYAAGSPGSPGSMPQVPSSDGAPLTFTATVENGDRYLEPFSPTHGLRVEREEGTLVIRPSGELSGSFALFLPESGEAVRLSLATHRPSSDDGYFMLTLSPGEVTGSTMPRDLTAVIDVSGSMSGEKMEQTRGAIVQLLGALGPDDRFRLISFSSGVTSYRPGWTRAVPDELAEARRWVATLRASGGTNIEGALDEAFRAGTPADRLPIVVFLTDGIPTVGERDPEAIADRADQSRGRARVFAFGVGYDVNTYLLDRLTVAARGTVEYVEPAEDVEHAVGLLAAAVRHPVLADLVIERIPGQVREVYPTRLPDLFAGQAVTIFGRYATEASGPVTIAGTREGRTVSFDAEGAFPLHALDNDFIPRLWAARRIGELTREARLHGPDPELIEEIRETALRYGILTEYTSHLVLEPGVVAGVRPEALPRHPPVGGDQARDQAVAGSFGRNAVMMARASGRARSAQTASDVVAMEAATAEAARVTGGAAGERADLQVVGGRGFVLHEGVWIDRMHADDARTVQIEAFSPAWFQLAEALPELRQWWSRLSPVVVAGREVSLAVGDEGASELSAAELQRIVSAFRAP
jgi:Ca-activated chloride channel homolog